MAPNPKRTNWVLLLLNQCFLLTTIFCVTEGGINTLIGQIG